MSKEQIPFHRAYGPRKAKKIYEPGESLTKQSFKDDCDLNVIMARYTKTGVLPTNLREDGIYGDFSEVGDYQRAQEIYLRANDQFQALPGKVRARFNNDPAEFLDFCSRSENKEEMVYLGLIDKSKLKELQSTPEPVTAPKGEPQQDPKQSTKAVGKSEPPSTGGGATIAKRKKSFARPVTHLM